MRALRSLAGYEPSAWGLLALAFLGVNLATSERSPVVWKDEVMFADPAVNLVTGRGFTTTAWFQPGDTPFAGNAPLYPMVLSGWLAAFGTGVVAVRSLNYVLALGMTAVVLHAARRHELVTTGPGRFLLAALILGGDGVTYSYRSGRYDCLGMLLVAGMFAATAAGPARARRAALFGLAVLAPWTGLQLIPYVALMGLLALWLKGRAAVAEVAAVAAGGAVGSAFLFAWFRANGVWDEFRRSVTYLGGARRTLAARVAEAVRAPITEPSSLLLLIALGAALIALLARREARTRSPVVVGLLVGVAVPCALGFAGKFVRYYAWTAYIPMALCVATTLERGLGSVWARGAVVAPCLLACAAGLPARLTVACLEWDLRSVGPVRRLVAGQVGPGDRVFTEFEAYYPAKKRASATYLPPYVGIHDGPGRDLPAAMTVAERARVNVLITKPGPVEDAALRYFGGPWAPVARYQAGEAGRVRLLARIGFGSRPYDLTVYRRPPAPAP